MNVRHRIRQYFSRTVAAKVGDADDIFALGVVDSLFAIQLVQFVEKEFLISAERADLDIKNFCSIDALTNFVLRKLGRAEDVEPRHGHATD